MEKAPPKQRNAAALARTYRRSVSCEICSVIFSNNASLNRHRNRFHNSAHICYLCNQIVLAETSIREHLKSHGIKGAVTCSCCKWYFRDRKEMQHHSDDLSNDGTTGNTVPIAATVSPDRTTVTVGTFLKENRDKVPNDSVQNKNWKQWKRSHIRKVSDDFEKSLHLLNRSIGMDMDQLSEALATNKEFAHSWAATILTWNPFLAQPGVLNIIAEQAGILDSNNDQVLFAEKPKEEEEYYEESDTEGNEEGEQNIIQDQDKPNSSLTQFIETFYTVKKEVDTDGNEGEYVAA